MDRGSSHKALMFGFEALVGAVIALLVWLFLKIANVGITVIWEIVPLYIDSRWYTLFMCAIGGVVIGLFHKKFGPYPQKMADAVKTVAQERTFPYQKLPMIVGASFLSLFFGGAVGPEAGLVSLLLGLAFWAKDQFGFARYNMELKLHNNPGMPKTEVFTDMMSGIFLPRSQMTYNTNVIQWTRAEQISSGVVTGITGLIVYILLNRILGACLAVPHLSGGGVTVAESWGSIVLILVGMAAGYLYLLFQKLTHFLFGKMQLKGMNVLSAVLGGLILGVIGSVLPMTMFSGGNDVQAMQYEYLQYTPMILIVIGLVKLFLTNVCIESGWRGGHFFPVLFAGLSIGYGISLLIDINQVFCVVVVTGALLGTILQQPIGALALSLIFFPIKSAPWMLLSCCVGGMIPVPKQLRVNPEQEPFVKKLMNKKKKPPNLPDGISV